MLFKNIFKRKGAFYILIVHNITVLQYF